jgi:Ca2+-binding RTX toxin-like protein
MRIRGAGLAWRRSVRLGVALGLSLVCIGIAAQTALAANEGGGPQIGITLKNEMSGADVALGSIGEGTCWFPEGLSNQGKSAAPGLEVRIVTRKKSVNGCRLHNGAVRLDISIKELKNPGKDRWYHPAGEPDDYILYYTTSGSGCDCGRFAGTFSFRNSLGTWLPRRAGHGLVCWHTATASNRNSSSANEDVPLRGDALIIVYSGKECNTAVPTEIQETDPPLTAAKANRPAALPGPFTEGPDGPVVVSTATARPQALVATDKNGAGTGGGSTGAGQAPNDTITDLLSSIGIACPWFAYPGQKQRCQGYKITEPGQWDIPKGFDRKPVVKAEVRGFGATATSLTTKAHTVCDEQSGPVYGPTPATLRCVKHFQAGSQYTTTTQHGFKVGVSFQFEQNAKVNFVLGEGNLRTQQELSFGYDLTKTEAFERNQQVSKDVEITYPAEPGYNTRFIVSTTDRAAKFEFNADLDLEQVLDKDGNPFAVSTPASVALNQSPSREQPCLAYAIGDKTVHGSIMYAIDQLTNAGWAPTSLKLTDPQRAFLASGPSWIASDAKKDVCPGFPDGYTRLAGFKGRGVGTYTGDAVDQNNLPVETMLGCVYRSKLSTKVSSARVAHTRLESPTELHADDSDNCQVVPITGGKVQGVTPGDLVDDRGLKASVARASAASVVVAPPGSDEILGPKSGGTIYTNNGAHDIAYAGTGPTRIIGGSGDNILHGGPGKDVLVGGRLGTNELDAGTGPTTMEESHGTATMYGGAGRDTFEGHDMIGVMVGGRGSSRMVATGNLSDLTMDGGTGPNTYVLKGSGTPTILQLPERVPSTLMSDHSIDVPEYVHKAIATGSRAVKLTGSFDTRSLTANRGANTLISGSGPETLRGGRGHDTIVFNSYNDDVAIGGGGPDRYIFTGSPETVTRPRALQYPAGRTAVTIANFNPAKGDRLVLSTAVFGSQITQLRHRFQLVAGPRPRPRRPGATLLLDTRSGVLSFDRDGTGPISDKVIAKLRGFTTIKRGWLQIR